MPKTPVRQFKAKKVRVLTKKRTHCLRKHCKEWMSNTLLYKKLKIGINYLAKALSKERQKAIERIEELQQLKLIYDMQMTAVSNAVSTILNKQKTMIDDMKNTISMCQEPNLTVSSASAERKESSNKSLNIGVVKPTVSGKIITKPTIITDDSDDSSVAEEIIEIQFNL